MWGPATNDKIILPNGQRYQVWRNLWDFLQIARQHGELSDDFLWVDAICINQTDISERNHQVRMMASIYKSASRTISWLGALPSLVGRSITGQSGNAAVNVGLSDLDGDLTRCLEALHQAKDCEFLANETRFPT